MTGPKAVPGGFNPLSSTTNSASSGGSLGSYQQVRSIGRGSFGEATLAKDSAGKLCVIKVVDITRLDKEQQGDAVNEVKVLSSLKHPYIVRYHESFLENGTLSIVMDYAEGGDLSKRIAQHREKHDFFAESQVVRWFTQTALGLKYLHARHILHRDLKPQNMFITKQDDLRLGDFGISKVLGSSSLKEETTIGTPYYFSPEICREKRYSFASDIWALGCILYELAALQVPFQAVNIPCLVRKITGGRLPAMPPVFSVELQQLCHEILCQDYNHRPSAPDILRIPMIQAEMRQMLQDAPVKADAKASPPLGQCFGRTLEPDKRMLGSLLCPLNPEKEMKRAPSAPAVPTAGRKMLRESGSNVLNSSTGALNSSTGALKTAWGAPEMQPKESVFGMQLKEPAFGRKPKEAAFGMQLNEPAFGMKPKEPAFGMQLKEAAFGCEKLSSTRNSNMKRPCASPLLGMGMPRCGATRGNGRPSRRRPAVVVWDIH